MSQRAPEKAGPERGFSAWNSEGPGDPGPFALERTGIEPGDLRLAKPVITHALSAVIESDIIYRFI